MCVDHCLEYNKCMYVFVEDF